MMNFHTAQAASFLVRGNSIYDETRKREKEKENRRKLRWKKIIPTGGGLIEIDRIEQYIPLLLI